MTYTASTIGASFLMKELLVNQQKVTLQIWDTAGQERFRSMAPLYYRGAVAAILVFSMTDESSFEKLKEWVRELQSNVDEPLVLAIACNKADLAEQRTVSYDAATSYAASIGALIYETSAKNNTGAPPPPRPPALATPARARQLEPLPTAAHLPRRRQGAVPRGRPPPGHHSLSQRGHAVRRTAVAARPAHGAREEFKVLLTAAVEGRQCGPSVTAAPKRSLAP